MWNQPEEYFIEVISNASMEDFPTNTLTKFTNKLPTPLELDGEWVVGIQEIFYPIDLEPEERKVQVQLFTSDIIDKQILDVYLKENDSPEMIISKINDALNLLFNKIIADSEKETNDRTKRSLDKSENRVQSAHGISSPQVGELVKTPLTLAEVYEITPEKIRNMEKNDRLDFYERITVGIPIILDRLYKEMEIYRSEVSKKSSEIINLNERLRTFTNQLDEVKASKLEEHQKYKTLKNDYDKKITDLNTINTNISNLNEKTNKLEHKLRLSGEEVQKAQEKLNKINGERNEKERELNALRITQAQMIQEHTKKN